MRFMLPEIKELLTTRKKNTVRKVISYFDPADIAEVWPEFTVDEKLKLFNTLDKKIAADIFSTAT